MEHGSEAILTDLEQLERAWNAITETPLSPRSTMDVIEYGLGRQKRAEVYVNRLLCYLLDPHQPHGLGTEFLERFLDSLPAAMAFEEDTYDLSDVRVDEQVRVGNGDSWALPDLVVEVPGEWFLLIELKFSAEESGTTAYAEAQQIRDTPVDEYESGRYYLYMHRSDEPTATSDSFGNWTWEDFVTDVLEPVITDAAHRFPQRTATQLYDLRDDLSNLTPMSDQPTADEEKIALYLDHVDAIEDVSATFDEAWDDYAERWGDRLAAHLDAEDGVDVHATYENQYPEIVVPREDTGGERWILRSLGGDWQHLHRYGWYRDAETLENLVGRAEDRDDLRIGFYHRMGKHRDAAVRDERLEFKFRNMGSNPSGFKQIYSDAFDARADRVSELLTETNAELTGNKLTKITASYDLPVDTADGFFAAYTEALGAAVTELVIERPELIGLLTETFDEAVEEYSE